MTDALPVLSSVRSDADVQAIAQVTKLRPTEEQVIEALGKDGHRRRYLSAEECAASGRSEGSYDWSLDFTQNERGKLTKQGEAAQELMRPFIVADTERVASMKSAETVAMRDADGHTQFIRPALADSQAERRGWRHKIRVKGKRVMITRGSLVFRLTADGWQVSGESRESIVWAPDGRPWRLIAGEWRMVGGA